METTEIIRTLREYAVIHPVGRYGPDVRVEKSILTEAADRLEELSELLNEWEPVVNGITHEPVVHAHWVEDDHGCCRNCSACGFRVGDDTSYDLYGDWKIAPKRCPECGAHMDEEVADGIR